jgi:hypothetical protein
MVGVLRKQREDVGGSCHELGPVEWRCHTLRAACCWRGRQCCHKCSYALLRVHHAKACSIDTEPSLLTLCKHG